VLTDDELQCEVVYWRDLLTRVAKDLERAAGSEADAKRKAWFTSRAMRIRQRLHDGMPEGWSAATYDARMNASRPSAGPQ
jgi:hypothetical protein